MISPYLEKAHVEVNLDECVVEIVKNGKRYSVDEFIEERINDVLNLRMQEDRE